MRSEYERGLKHGAVYGAMVMFQSMEFSALLTWKCIKTKVVPALNDEYIFEELFDEEEARGIFERFRKEIFHAKHTP